MVTDDQAKDRIIEVLEKTNNALTAWVTSLGVIVAVLTVLVALATVWITIVLWLSSREQKKATAEATRRFFDEQRKFQQTMIRKARADLDKLIKKKEQELEKAKDEGRKAITLEIDRLKAEKDSLGSGSTPIGSTSWIGPFSNPWNSNLSNGSSSLGGFSPGSSYVCNSCKKAFNHNNQILASPNNCPYCFSNDITQGWYSR